MIKKIQKRHLPAILIVVIVLILAVVVFLNFKAKTPSLETTPEHVEADLALGEFEYTETRHGRRQWTIVADSAGYHKDQERTDITNPRITFYGQEQESDDLFLSARNGQVNTETRELEVWGDVLMESAEGYTLQTERLFYDDTQRLITTQDPVRILYSGFDVRGRGLRLDVTQRSLEILNEVEALLESRLWKRQTE